MASGGEAVGLDEGACGSGRLERSAVVGEGVFWCVMLSIFWCLMLCTARCGGVVVCHGLDEVSWWERLLHRIL